MDCGNKSKPHHYGHEMGILWFIGWLFTIGYVQPAWWKIIMGIVVWPYFLGVHVR